MKVSWLVSYPYQSLKKPPNPRKPYPLKPHQIAESFDHTNHVQCLLPRSPPMVVGANKCSCHWTALAEVAVAVAVGAGVGVGVVVVVVVSDSTILISKGGWV